VSDPSDPTAPPDWAVERAREALKGGMSPAEVEWRLISLGLTRAAAAAAVHGAPEKRAGPPDERQQGISPEKKAGPVGAARPDGGAARPPAAPPAAAAAAEGVQQSRLIEPHDSRPDVVSAPKAEPIGAPRLDVDVTKPPGAPPSPDWAVERAHAALNVGVSVPDIERQLVEKGLSPEAAAAVVNRVLAGKARTTGAREPSRVELLLHRTLSGVVGGASILLGLLFSVWSACAVALYIAVPLGCVWFGEWVGTYWRWRPRRIQHPGVVLRLAGWVLLAGVFIYRLVLVIFLILYIR
jgi:hypothetical protein